MLIDDANVLQISEDFIVVDGVSNDEFVRNLETGKIRQKPVALWSPFYSHRRYLNYERSKINESVVVHPHHAMSRKYKKSTCSFLVYSLVHSPCSLIRLLRTAHSARCANSLARSAALIRSRARSLTHFRAHWKGVFEMNTLILCSFNP